MGNASVFRLLAATVLDEVRIPGVERVTPVNQFRTRPPIMYAWYSRKLGAGLR